MEFSACRLRSTLTVWSSHTCVCSGRSRDHRTRHHWRRVTTQSVILEPEGVTQYQSLVGQLQWAISLGRLDIATAVMTMSSFRSCPRIGHLARAKRICGYLLNMKEACIRFRTGLPDYSDLEIPHYSWADSVYGNPKENIPTDAPTPLGLPVILTHYVDANLYHCMLTGRSVI